MIVLMLGLVAAGTRVGHLGGELVYSHGAADEYLDQHTRAKQVHDDD